MGTVRTGPWPLRDIAITNIEWYVLQQRGIEGTQNIAQKCVCDEGGKWCAQTKVVFAKDIIDSCT